MIDQLDMFAQPRPASPPALRHAATAIIQATPASTLARDTADIAQLLPSPCVAWSQALARASGAAVHVAVALRWTGVVIETLRDPRVGLLHLHHDRTIRDHQQTNLGTPGRLVFRTFDQAQDLHRRHGLIEVCGGTAFAMFRFAAQDEAVVDLRLLVKGSFA